MPGKLLRSYTVTRFVFDTSRLPQVQLRACRGATRTNCQSVGGETPIPNNVLGSGLKFLDISWVLLRGHMIMILSLPYADRMELSVGMTYDCLLCRE